MIKDLCDYYDYLKVMNNNDKKENDSIFLEIGFEFVPIQNQLILNKDGSINDVINNDKPKQEIFPIRFNYSKFRSYIIEHRGEYLFGAKLDESNKKEKKLIIAKKEDKKDEKEDTGFENLVRYNKEYLEDLSSPVIDAFKGFMNTWDPNILLDNSIQDEKIKKIRESLLNNKATFSICIIDNNQFNLHEDKEIKNKWRNFAYQKYKKEWLDKEQNNKNENDLSSCGITGKENVEIARIHFNLKNIIGGNATGNKLISFKYPAYWSYGKEESYNSYVSMEAMEKYTYAINYLTNPNNKKHNYQLGETTLLTFVMPKNTSDKEYMNFINDLLGNDRNEEATEAITNDVDYAQEIISQSVANASKGRKINLKKYKNLDKDNDFYFYAIMPYSGRLAVKFYYKNSFGNIFENVNQYFNDMKIFGDEEEVTINEVTYKILKIIKDKKEDKKEDKKKKKSEENDNSNKKKKKKKSFETNLYIKILNSVLTGYDYPKFMFYNALHQIKRKHGEVYDIFYRLVHAYLTRKYKGDFMKEQEQNQFPYLFGQLLAIYERIQYVSENNSTNYGTEHDSKGKDEGDEKENEQTGRNRTIKDVFFKAACVSPSAVFAKMNQRISYSLKKLGRDKGYPKKTYYEKMIEDIMVKIHDAIENLSIKQFSLEQQGIFVLAYYKKRHEFFEKKLKENEINKDEEIINKENI